MEQSLNLAWVLIAGFLVMFMQVGFAMVETGFTRAKNAVNTMGMNLMVYPVGVIGFWLVGYALMLGGVREWPSRTIRKGEELTYDYQLERAGHWRKVWAARYACRAPPGA